MENGCRWDRNVAMWGRAPHLGERNRRYSSRLTGRLRIAMTSPNTPISRNAAELMISLTGMSAYQGPVSITRRQSACHPARQPIAGVGHLSGCSLFHPSDPRSRVKRKAERPRLPPPVRLKQGQFRSSEPPIRKSRLTIWRTFNLGLAGRRVRIPDMFVRVGRIDQCRDATYWRTSEHSERAPGV